MVTMSEYLRFSFLSGATIEKGSAITNQDLRVQHTVPPLPSAQAILDKTGHQKEVEIADPKIVATRERKAHATAKKNEKKKRGTDKGNPSEGTTNIAESQGDQSLDASHHNSANHYVHEDHTKRNLTIVPTEVLQTSPGTVALPLGTTSPARLSAQ
nr:hypothetical protein [Tanacetum cinerariifolium]